MNTPLRCLAIVVTWWGWSSATAAEDKPLPQYVYKTVGDRELKVDVLYPDDWQARDRRAAIVFFSGGAWRSGGTRQFLPQARYFAQRGMVTVRAEYRDSTRDKVNPDTCLKDAVTAMRWVGKNAERLGVDPQRIVSSGGSAGGYLAAAVATIEGFHSGDDDLTVSPRPNAMVLFNPVLDFVDRAAEFNITGELAQRISPLRHVSNKVPSTLILIGSQDRFLEQNQQFMSKAAELGVRVEIDLAEGQPHAYFNRSPWLEKTVASADRFLVALGYLREEPRVELPSSLAADPEASLALEVRSRVEALKGSGQYEGKTDTRRWDARTTAIIVCDMWDDHTCKGAAARVAEMAPALNRTIKAARDKGVLIVHAPSGTTSFYQDLPQRRRAIEAPLAKAPIEIKWNYWDENREGKPLASIVDGGCSCKEPCRNFVADEQGIRHWKKGEKVPWTRQIASIEIAASDAIGDNGQEIYNLLQDRKIDNVVVMGVHTNICVCGRPFGLRQMAYYGKNVVLCRDLTDSLFQATMSDMDHFRGTDMIVAHIERHICPTITSTSFTGQPAFRFREDTQGR